MNFEELLKGKECACGMKHTCAVKHIIIGRNANEKLGDLLGDIQALCTGKINIGRLITAVVEAMDAPQIAKLRGVEGHHDGPVSQAIMVQVNKYFMLRQG